MIFTPGAVKRIRAPNFGRGQASAQVARRIAGTASTIFHAVPTMLTKESDLPGEFKPGEEDGFGRAVEPSQLPAPKPTASLLKSSVRQVMVTNQVVNRLIDREDSWQAAKTAMGRAAAASRESALSYDSDNWCATIMHVKEAVNRFVAVPWAFVTGCCIFIELLSLMGPEMEISGGVTVALGGLMSLLLAFRLNTSFGRWWEARNLWGTVIVGSRSLVLQVLSSKPDAPHTEHTRTPPDGSGGAAGGGGSGGASGYVADDAQFDVVSSAAAWTLGFAVPTHAPFEPLLALTGMAAPPQSVRPPIICATLPTPTPTPTPNPNPHPTPHPNPKPGGTQAAPARRGHPVHARRRSPRRVHRRAPAAQPKAGA